MKLLALLFFLLRSVVFLFVAAWVAVWVFLIMMISYCRTQDAALYESDLEEPRQPANTHDD